MTTEIQRAEVFAQPVWPARKVVNDSRHAGYISWSPKDVFDRSYHQI